MNDNLPAYNNSNSLRMKKDKIIEQLKVSFSEGSLSLEDYEYRVTEAVNSIDINQLEKIVSDLPKIIITESESFSCKMVTKELEGSILHTKKLIITAVISTITIDYQKILPFIENQEIIVHLDKSNLILFLPEDTKVENRIEEKMLTYKDNRNTISNNVKSNTLIKLAGSAKISTITIESK